VTEHPTAPWQVSHHPAARLFVGSAVKMASQQWSTRSV
jgi:hypothetical protein